MYSTDGLYMGTKNDDIDGIRIINLGNKSTLSTFKDEGFLTDTDGSLISCDDFHQLVAMIYGEATGLNVDENKGMGEVVKNRMNESGLNLLDMLNNKYSHFDARDNKTSKYLSGLQMMVDKTEINKNTKNSDFLRKAIAGAIHGLSEKESVLNKAPYYWSHGINRNGLIYEKIGTIQTCDFYTLTEDSWNKNKRYWP